MLGFSSTDPMNPMNFSALTFEDHTLKGATKARHIFENGDGISVVRFSLKWIECAMITK